MGEGQGEGKDAWPGGTPGAPRWAIAVGSFGYVGFSPCASGTVASLVAVGLYCFVPGLQQSLVLVGLSLLLMAAGTKAASVIVSVGHESDPSFVVSDEVVGQWLALVSPVHQGNPAFVVSSFVFFRLFDIAKPFPASYFDRRRGGFHVMMDDVVAGLYANLAAHLLLWLGAIAF